MAAAAVQLVVACGALGSSEASVYEVTVSGDGTEVAFAIDACSRPVEGLVVDESADEVRVTARVQAGDDLADCAVEMTRTLDAPLGDRRVVDGATGDVITRINDETG